jgi:hypothetical protein
MIPEHEPIEVAEPVAEEAAGSAHAHPPATGHPDVHGVLVACLAQTLPCPVCGRTEACRCARPPEYSATSERATLIEQALIHYGYLPDPKPLPVFDEVETAQWLAERSGFARYTQVKDGWRRLIESEIDVEIATTNALRRVPTDEVEIVKAAKAALLAWHQTTRTKPDWMG